MMPAQITVQDCLRWQLDTVSTAAEQVVGHLIGFDPPPELEPRSSGY